MLLSEKLMMKKWSPRLYEYYRTGRTDPWSSFYVYCGAGKNTLIGTTGGSRKARFLNFNTFLWGNDLNVQNFSTTDSGSGDLVFYDGFTVDNSTHEQYVYKTTVDQVNRTVSVDTTTISTAQAVGAGEGVTSGLLLDINVPISGAHGFTRNPIVPGSPSTFTNDYSLFAGSDELWADSDQYVSTQGFYLQECMVYNKIASDVAIGVIGQKTSPQYIKITSSGYTVTNFGDLDCSNHLFYDNAFYYTKNNLVKKLNSSYASVWSVSVLDPLGNPMTPRLLGIYNNKAYVIGLPVDENQTYLGCMFYEISLSTGAVLRSCKFGSEFATSTERGAANVRAAMRTNYTYKPYVSQTGEFAIAVNYYDFIIADVS